ncbi:hypothetical protein [Pantoea sp. MQR6]|uniref:hypothetical protein n=1 Tax=Pantoea sp. MQR6 TaxID=2907307 RepID=UPI001FAA4C22|nr:hypothetical protein [Pantoea sp. MQR6]
MESYVFRTNNGFFGYLQIESDQENCTLLLNCGHFNLYKKYTSKISSAQQQINSPHVDLSWIKSTDPIIKMINVLCWINGECNSLPVEDAHKNTSPGEYYPRSIRDAAQLCGAISSPPLNESEILNEVRTFSSIASGLIKIFDYIEPDVANLNVYGNKLRELLFLACAEVEYLWLKFLQANSYPIKRSYSTVDYIKCLPHLKLDGYEVQLINFPLLGSLKPFDGWSSQQPTQSLSWYEAYNSVKHNRGANMPMATLKAVINAIAAIYILLKAQHGHSEFGAVIDMPNIDLFKTITSPSWTISEIAMPLLGDVSTNWTSPVNITL